LKANSAGCREEANQYAESLGACRCKNFGKHCQFIYCCAQCRDSDNYNGHTILCVGSKDNIDDPSRTLASAFQRYCYRTNELFILASRIISRWICSAKTVARVEMKEFDITRCADFNIRRYENLFEQQLAMMITKFFSLYPIKKSTRVPGRKRPGSGSNMKKKKKTKAPVFSTPISFKDELDHYDEVNSLRIAGNSALRNISPTGEDEDPEGGRSEEEETPPPDDSIDSNDITNEQIEESWELFRSVILFGRARVWTESLVSSATCSPDSELARMLSEHRDISSGRSSSQEPQLIFSQELWKCLLLSLESNVITLTLPSPLAAMARRVPQLSTFEERLEAGGPLIQLADEFLRAELGPIRSRDDPAEFRKDIERRIVRIAQAAVKSSEDAFFDRFECTYLALVPALAWRPAQFDPQLGSEHEAHTSHFSFESIKAAAGCPPAPFVHSCLPSAHVEASVDSSVSAEATPSCALNVKLIALRNIYLCAPGSAFYYKSFLSAQAVTVSRLLLSAGPASAESARHARATPRCVDDMGLEGRARRLRLIYSDDFCCSCPLCSYERILPSGFSALKTAYIAELFRENEDAKPLLIDNGANDEPKPIPYCRRDLPINVHPLAPPHPLALDLGSHVLYALGEKYMQEAQYHKAIAVYGQVVKVAHYWFRKGKSASQESGCSSQFDATCYHYLGSALLDAGRKQA
jgi:hypothetical protein